MLEDSIAFPEAPGHRITIFIAITMALPNINTPF